MHRVQITTLQRGQVSVYCQDVSVNQRLVISRVDARHWELARALWMGGKWVTQELIATYPAQAVALVQAGAWFERVALATAPPAAQACTVCGWAAGPLNGDGLCYQCGDPDAAAWDATHRIR